MDLDRESRDALEFDALLDWVASFARSPFGAAAIRELSPSDDASGVRRELEAVAETRSRLIEEGKLIPERLGDPAAATQALDVAGLRIAPKALRELATVLLAAGRLRRALSGLDRESFRHLRELGQSLPDLSANCESVLRGTDGEGRILDEASPELRRIRSGMSRVSERLQRMLRRLLQDPDAASVIQDDFITQRNGRYVVPVRTDAPRPMRGIVHASSSSGATRFVEPLESVELNNDLVRFAEEERDEQERVVAAWADAFRRCRREVEDAVRGLTRADTLQARALFGEALGGTIPRVEPGGPFRLEEVRHPLLDRRLREAGGRCVPATLVADPADRVTVLSGPNTGGKTVVLKTVGLGALMAQCGIPLAARRAELPLYRQVRADIGDHQSIQADLSTYSAHIGAVVEILQRPSPPALLLFDEIGTGTEPTEGAALAQSILESLLRPGISVWATTHLGALKAWAVTTEGATCAAMEFDTVSLKPTYRILMDTAGVSAGLEIAERLGLDREIVERARGRLDPEARRSEEYLRRLRASLEEAEAARASLRDREHQLEERVRRFEGRMEREAAERKKQGERRLERALAEFRKRARQELAALGGEARTAAERRLRRADRRVQLERSRGAASLEESAAPPSAAWEPPAELAPGMRVVVRSLGREGTLLSEREGEVEVRLGEATFRVRRDDLGLPVEPGAGEPAKKGSVQVTTPYRTSVPRELKLIGLRVDDALERLERFLDDAQLAGHDEVRVIHGHGTGRLRSAVREFLDASDSVGSHRPGGSREGGDGATVVTLV